MKSILKAEEFAMFLISIYAFSLLKYHWWLFPSLILVPDIGMIGYAFNTKIGAASYNLCHHKGIALLIFFSGIYLSLPLWQLAGIILFGHSSLDRMLGYGLKYNDGFKHTHLGKIGKN